MSTSFFFLFFIPDWVDEYFFFLLFFHSSQGNIFLIVSIANCLYFLLSVQRYRIKPASSFHLCLLHSISFYWFVRLGGCVKGIERMRVCMEMLGWFLWCYKLNPWLWISENLIGCSWWWLPLSVMHKIVRDLVFFVITISLLFSLIQFDFFISFHLFLFFRYAFLTNFSSYYLFQQKQIYSIHFRKIINKGLRIKNFGN
ncbi:hypothetical protein RchiOBHm_Chr2g0138321 [Rosa chinensis]|uniref:Uncharacterized protein n=1 Tax=Rosa chinensis TaxID=74649 RepID=A0A2P6RWW0_ROSCH|nr:hypothetical protein RchiOBHm_Chr2g0138321 [Rosa chinensis]